jgi:hypothetical protein
MNEPMRTHMRTEPRPMRRSIAVAIFAAFVAADL